MRIVYCLDSISYLGGIETVVQAKANWFAQSKEHSVYLIVAEHRDITTGNVILSDKVNLINLNINYFEDYWKIRYKLLWSLLKKRFFHLVKLNKILKKISPDIVISTGMSEKLLLPLIKGNFKILREYHFGKDFRNFTYKETSSFNRKMLKIGDFFEKKFILKRYDSIAVLTQEDLARNWKGWNNISIIPNPVTFSSNKTTDFSNKKIIAVGRYVEQKDFPLLIGACKFVFTKHPDWKLEIFGEGHMRQSLQRQIENLKLEKNIFLTGKSSNIANEYQSSSIFVLSSLFEGMPLVLLEAMETGLAVVSTDCPYGPKDIIDDGIDGYIITNRDERRLAEKINYLIENPMILKKIGSAAHKKAQNFKIDKIMTQWLNLFKSLIGTN